MEKEVLSKHRKALMLFGTFHLMHGTGSAVSIYEKEYPGITFVITDLGIYDTNRARLTDSKFVTGRYRRLPMLRERGWEFCS